MTKEEIARARWCFGPAPILSSERPEQFEEFFTLLANSLKPKDFTELLLIWHFTVESWQVNRTVRHAAVAIERRREEIRQNEEQRTRLEQARRQSQNRNSCANCTPSDIAKVASLEEKVLATPEDVDDILNRAAAELNHNRAFEGSIAFQERLDTLITSAARRRDDALKLLDIYRAGLGAQAKEIAAEILDGECREVILDNTQAPGLVPPHRKATHDPQSASTSTDDE
jgi:hypothetical protein